MVSKKLRLLKNFQTHFTYLHNFIFSYVTLLACFNLSHLTHNHDECSFNLTLCHYCVALLFCWIIIFIMCIYLCCAAVYLFWKWPMKIHSHSCVCKWLSTVIFYKGNLCMFEHTAAFRFILCKFCSSLHNTITHTLNACITCWPMLHFDSIHLKYCGVCKNQIDPLQTVFQARKKVRLSFDWMIP